MDPTLPSVEGFWQFVNLRMEAYHLHAAGLPSPDPVLATGWYPNVKRELDRGTLYFQAQIRGREPDVVPLSICYRLSNRRQTFEAYGSLPHDFADFRTHLKRLRSVGGQIFTGRHQTIGLPKYLETLEYLGGPWSVPLPSLLDSILHGERATPWAALRELVPGVASFSAWQVICDVQETYALDENLWAYMGPGPQGAYQMIHGRRGTQKTVLTFARGLVQDTGNLHQLTLKNIEHALCEYFRYTRAWWAR